MARIRKKEIHDNIVLEWIDHGVIIILSIHFYIHVYIQGYFISAESMWHRGFNDLGMKETIKTSVLGRK